MRLALLIMFCLGLTACESAKYYECIVRDTTSRPCN